VRKPATKANISGYCRPDRVAGGPRADVTSVRRSGFASPNGWNLRSPGGFVHRSPSATDLANTRSCQPIAETKGSL